RQAGRVLSICELPAGPVWPALARGVPSMIVGVPREIKADEYRVAMLPVGVEELISAGHQVLMEANAGQGSGIVDALYETAGATIVPTAEEIWANAEMVVKVKEPQPEEWPLLRQE